MDVSTSLFVTDVEISEPSFRIDYRDWPVRRDPHCRQNSGSRDTFVFLVTSEHVHRLSSLSHHAQSECESDIRNLCEVAGMIDWDGEGADSVSEDAVRIALDVVKDFPGDVGRPEVSADPHGRVDFDWHLDNGAMFTISIAKDGEAAISGLYEGQSRLTGMAWDKEKDIPSLVYCGLEWLAGMKSR